MCKLNLLLFFLLFSLLQLPLWAQTSKFDKLRFKSEIPIISDSIEVNPTITANRSNIIIYQNYLLLIEPTLKPIFSLLSLIELKFISDLNIKIKDFEAQLNLDSKCSRSIKSGFEVFDIYKGFLSLNIEKSINGSYLISTSQISIPGELFPLNDAIRLNDSIICGIPYGGLSGKSYIKYNYLKNKITCFGDYPKLYPTFNSPLFWLIYGRRSVVKPDNSKFASFCRFVKMFRIYSADQTLIKEVIIEKQDNLIKGKDIQDNPKYYYTSLKSTDKYIYALCYNQIGSKLNQSIPRVEVWDWNGNPVVCLIPDRPIFEFDVSIDNKSIYFINWHAKNYVFKSDISKFLD
jgi:hypothetical protein